MTLLDEGQEWGLHEGDCISHMADMPAQSVDMAVFSPPFPQLYAYSSEASDVGNSEDLQGDAKLHLSFFYHALARILRPGRVCMVHVAQISRMKRAGGTGLHDFRGLNIRLAERAGLVFEYEWAVRKNPQSQALRTRSRGLQFAGLESDRAGSRGALPDHLLKFRAQGVNPDPIRGHDQVSRNEWIEWAEHCWADIRETDTLNTRNAKGDEDTRHICPLQLDVIDRLVRLFSNPGEVIFSPFAGIGSEDYTAPETPSPVLLVRDQARVHRRGQAQLRAGHRVPRIRAGLVRRHGRGGRVVTGLAALINTAVRCDDCESYAIYCDREGVVTCADCGHVVADDGEAHARWIPVGADCVENP